MPEVNVRECYIHLLDGSKLTLQVKPLQLASDLLSIIADHLKLRERDHFGLYYDVNGEYQCWLQPGRPVVEQVPGTNLDIIILHFGAILFYESFKQLHDCVAQSLYYSQCQQLIYKSQLQCTPHTLIKLTAISLQAQLGDFTSEQVAIGGLRELKYLPNSLTNTETYEECEEEILTQYRLLVGMQKNEAISMYLEIFQELPSYGMHFYSVKDRNEEQRLIGIGLYGITQFSMDNRNRPEEVYLWTGISKISSRDNKFMIEINNQSLDLDKLQVDENVFDYSVPSYKCQNITTVQVWHSDSLQMIRVMEEMAVTQLNSYEQRKKIRMGIRLFSSTSSTGSISSIGSISHCSSGCTMKSDNSTTSMEATQAARLAGKEHYNALKNKKEEIEKTIDEKEAEMRRIMIEEAKLTGIIPDDLTEEEKASLPKQMATSYTLQYLVDSELFTSLVNESMSITGDPENDKEVKRLSREYEIQCNIVKAHFKLYKGTYTSKRIKKQRKKNYKTSEKKLKEIEKALEKRREYLGISCRQSRFYSQVPEKDDYYWEVLTSKSFTMPHKQQLLSTKLSSVDENRITQQNASRKTTRHSSALPTTKIDTSLFKIRQAKHSTSATVYNKKSNASDSISTASPLDGSSFLSLYSRDSSSRIGSSSITSDEDRCISCPATEEMQRKLTIKTRDDYVRQKRISQHLDLALPEKSYTGKKDDPIHNLNLDTPLQVIFKPPTRYPNPTPANSLPFPSSSQSPREFYARSLPLDYNTNNEEPKRFDIHSANFGKYQFTSDQISKQQYEHKLTYTQHNSVRCNRTPSPHMTYAPKTNYPVTYMRVNSVPYGLHSSKYPSHEKINSVQPVKNVTSYSHTHLAPHHSPYPNSNAAIGPDKLAYYYQPHSNGTTQTLPITRIHTTPANITTLEYTKPTHYPRAISPKLKHTNAQTRFPPRAEFRVSAQNPILSQPYVRTQNPILSQPYVRTQNPATNRYILPTCRIQITPPETEHYSIGQHRYKSPYSHQQYIPAPREDRYYNPNSNQTHQVTHSQHDPLAYTTSLPMSSQDLSPGVRCKIDYWEEYHSTVNAKPKMHISKSVEKLGKKSVPEFSPPPENNRQSLNFQTESHNFRNMYNSESNTSAYQRDYTKGMQPASDEGTPV